MQTKKIIYAGAASLIVLSLVAAGAVLGYRYYKTQLLKDKIEEAIGRDSGLTETILKVEKESSNMNYKELFDLCDKSIDGRTNLIVELRGLYADVQFDLKEKLIGFLNNENELVRAKRNFYRKQLEFSTKKDALQEQVQDTPSSEYGWDYYLERRTRLKNELVQSISELEAGADEYSHTYQKLAEQEAVLSRQLSESNIRFNSMFAKYQEDNNKVVLEAKKNAQAWKKMLAVLSTM